MQRLPKSVPLVVQFQCGPSIGISVAASSAPRVRILPPLKVSWLSPVVGTRVRCRSRSLIAFSYTVASMFIRFWSSVASKPVSISRCRSGRRSGAPAAPEIWDVGSWPPRLLAVSSVNFCP
jgi:hypothetical protein